MEYTSIVLGADDSAEANRTLVLQVDILHVMDILEYVTLNVNVWT